MLILDSDGKRMCGRYCSKRFEAAAAQSEFERSLFSKTSRTQARSEAEIILFNKNVVVYRFATDVYFYVTGSSAENELILASVLNCLVDSLTTLLRNQLDKRTLMDNLEIVLMTLDEVIDGGMILEHDSNMIVSRVSMKDSAGGGGGERGRGLHDGEREVDVLGRLRAAIRRRGGTTRIAGDARVCSLKLYFHTPLF